MTLTQFFGLKPMSWFGQGKPTERPTLLPSVCCCSTLLHQSLLQLKSPFAAQDRKRPPKGLGFGTWTAIRLATWGSGPTSGTGPTLDDLPLGTPDTDVWTHGTLPLVFCRAQEFMLDLMVTHPKYSRQILDLMGPSVGVGFSR